MPESVEGNSCRDCIHNQHQVCTVSKIKSLHKKKKNQTAFLKAAQDQQRVNDVDEVLLIKDLMN